MIRKVLFFLMLTLFLYSCGMKKNEQKIETVLDEWIGRQIVYPDSLVLWGADEGFSQDSFLNRKYKVITYVDSLGCMSCKLQLPRWKKWIKELQKEGMDISVLFFLSPRDEESLKILLQDYGFIYPVYIDINDVFNKKNCLPVNDMFHTFLLDQDNKIVAIGNPIHNLKVKELYMNVIRGKTSTNGKEIIQTKIEVKEQTVSLGHFSWMEEQKRNFILYNVGKHPLVINDVTTSCGCTSVDYSKQPVRPGDSISLRVTYKADKPEHFNKTITVYCNADPSLVHLKIVGDAE